MPIRLLLACQSRDVALALWARLVQSVGGRIDCEATNIGRVLYRARAAQPDVLLLEHDLADESGSWRQLLAQLRHASERTRLLLLCEAYTHHMVVEFVRVGVAGCVLKASDPSLLAKAVTAVHDGETWFGRGALLQALRSQVGTEPFVAPPLPDDQDTLTQREREILGLIGTAMSNKEIARRLQISDKTVKTHLHHIYVKLNQSGRYKAFLSNVAVVSGEYPAGHAGPAQ